MSDNSDDFRKIYANKIYSRTLRNTNEKYLSYRLRKKGFSIELV
jgi:hypothetical protein